MNILLISSDLAGGDLGFRLKKEGHSVKIYIGDKTQRHNLNGILEKVSDWRQELNWVGKGGLIVFDNIGYGKVQDELKSAGYSVIGGCEEADKIEHNRQYGQKVFADCGMKIVKSFNFTKPTDAIKFLKKNKGPFVIKQNGHVHTSFNYVGKLENNEDAISVLKSYNKYNKADCKFTIDLQEKIKGVEVGVARYFNGNDWVGPIEINLEHKDLCNESLGPKTFEMGTLLWLDNNEENRLFQETLAKMKPFLQKINFRGDIDVNCIVNNSGAYPIEPSARFGWPATHLHEELFLSPIGEFFKAVADGKQYDLKYKKGYGIVVLVATPPFPYVVKTKKYYPEGIEINFKEQINEEFLKHIHFEEVSVKKEKKSLKYIISSKTGFILHVTNTGQTVEQAMRNTYDLVDKIVIPKMFYRTDIGKSFIEGDESKLKKWGWI